MMGAERSPSFEADDQITRPRSRASSAATVTLPPLSVLAIVVRTEAPLALVDFWSRVFGIPATPGSTVDSASLMTSPRLPALAFERVSAHDVQLGGLTVRTYTDDLDGHRRRLEGMGLHASRPQERTDGQNLVQILDPEGNRIVIIQR